MRVTVAVFVLSLIAIIWGCAPSPKYTVGRKGVARTPSSITNPEYKPGSGSAVQTDPQQKKLKPGTVVKGLASYYADQYHGRLTANGETFDMNGLSAAHKTWPFNTWIEVTNLSNGRSVIVRINDRGPYVGNRILDLSLGAAKEIGMIGAGVQEVSIEILP